MTDGRGPVRWALQRHLAGAVAVLVGVVVLAVVVAERLAAAESLSHAETDARLLAAEYVAPLAADDLHSDGSAARRTMAEALDVRIATGSLRQVKIWASGTGAGTEAEIVFSDRADLEGRTFDLGDQHRLFGTTRAMANTVSTVDYGDASLDGTIEVYVGFVDRDGSPFVFEAYLPRPQTAISRGELLREWLPVVIGSLVLLTLTSLPLSVLLARRVASAERDRRRAVGSALDAALDERRRLSRRLHDGVVQDLAGISLALDGLAARSDDHQAQAVLTRTGELVRADLAELRAVGEGLFVDHLGSSGLTEAVEELVRATDCGTIDVRLRVDPDLDIPEQTSLLTYRVVREGLRNAVAHSSATSISIGLDVADEQVDITVVDDGRGLDTDVDAATPGHWGLQLLRIAAQDAGGSFEIESTQGVGTTLTVRLPVAPQPPAT